MKVCIGHKKVKGKMLYGTTILSRKGVVLYSSVVVGVDAVNKYDPILDSLGEGLSKINPLIEQGVLPEESIEIFITSELVYQWCQQEYMEEPYFTKHQRIVDLLSGLMVKAELILSSSGASRVLYKDVNNRLAETENALDFLSSIKG